MERTELDYEPLRAAIAQGDSARMERTELDYEPLRAAIARGDSAHIEVEARKLRDQEIGKLVARAAAAAWSVIIAIRHGALAWRTHLYEVAPKTNRLLNFIRM